MGAKIGRPKSENPKNWDVNVRVDKKTYERLTAYCAETGKCKADVVRDGLERILWGK